MRTLRRHPATRLLTRCLIVALVLGVAPELASASYATTPSVGLIHADYIGSVRRLTDEAGSISDGYTYSAFGELLAHTGSDPQPYAFTGEPLDPNVGWQYHRARWMDPRVGRFAGSDPFSGSAAHPGTLHRYLFANDAPADRVDPSGLFADVGLGALMGMMSMMNTLGAISLPLAGAAEQQQLRGAPGGKELAQHQVVKTALEQAWADSFPSWPSTWFGNTVHEEGGWIYANPKTGSVAVRSAAPGSATHINLNNPYPVPEGSYTVGNFHTHPQKGPEYVNVPTKDDPDDVLNYDQGVPGIIRTFPEFGGTDGPGVFVYGPERRRGGFTGKPGYPWLERQ